MGVQKNERRLEGRICIDFPGNKNTTHEAYVVYTCCFIEEC